MNLNLDNFMEILDEAMPDSFTIDEKIMSKKEARRRRREAKKLARQKELEKQQAEEQAKQDQQNSENPQENDEQDNQEDQEEKAEPKAALVVYQNVDDDYDEITEEFSRVSEILSQATNKHKDEIQKAMDMWENIGRDKACPQEAWNLMNESITEYKNTVEQTINSMDTNKLAAPELQLLDRYVTGINGYIEKASQQILAAKPHLVEQDFKAPVEQGSSEVATQTGTQVATTTSTALTTVGSTELAPIDTTPLEEPEVDDKRKYKDLVDYDAFAKGWDNLWDALKALADGLTKLLTAIAKKLLQAILAPVDFLNDKLFGFLTSPLAVDTVKALMYANPLTKMIFDGDFGKLGIGDSLNKLHDATKNAIARVGKSSDPTKEKPDNYTSRKFPKSLDDLTYKQLKKEFYGNRAFVDCINVSYNHPEVKVNDKADLQKYVTHITRAFKSKNVPTIRTTFNNIIKVLNKICDYMDWVKPSDWQRLTKLYVKMNGGNTQKDLDKMKNRNKPKSKKDDYSNLTVDPYRMSKDLWDNLSKEQQEEYPQGWRERFQKGDFPVNPKKESLDIKLTNLEKLLEEAER